MSKHTPQQVIDPLLGNLLPHIQAGEFSGAWEGSFDLPCFKEPLVFWVMIMRSKNYADTDFQIPEFSLSDLQKAFVQDFIHDCASYAKRFFAAILEGLQKDPTVWGMFSEESEELELISSISSVEDLKEHLAEPHLYILPDVDGKVAYGFGYWEPAWDPEHGYGVRFVDNALQEAGPMEVAQG
jgi:hypothetical protein